MAINMMCMNSKCINYWEDNCTKNLNEEKIVISEYGVCRTFERGESEWYKQEEKLIELADSIEKTEE